MTRIGWTVAMMAALLTVTTAGPAHAESDWIKELRADCAKGKGQACTNLGGQLELDVVRPADLPGARKAYETGCAITDWTADGSCVALYRMLSLGQGGPKDLARAATIEKRACGTGIAIHEVELERVGLCRK
jgi:hypothetical protein